MSRSISEFNGQGVVVGCSHKHSFCNGEHHQGESNFYTIDLNPAQSPDLIFDITHPLPAALQSRFQLAFLECLDYKAYNDNPERNFYHGAQGFQNIWDMTTENGFIVIKGCPRLKEYRQQVATRHLNYIELDNMGECVLIPKNQALSYDNVIEQIEKLNPAFKKTINECKKWKGGEVNPRSGFCDLDYNCFDTVSYLAERNAKSSSDEISEETKINAFKVIYSALYQGQRSFFKQKTPLLSQSQLTVAEIELYVKVFPNSRSAKAWDLVQKHSSKLSLSNHDLFAAIHRHSLKHSSSFFGLFKRSVNFPNGTYSNIDAKINNADEDSRTGQIKKFLSNF